MRHKSVTRRFWFATFLLTIVAAVLIRNVAATSRTQPSLQSRPFSGQVLSASGALDGGAAGRAVVGATIHLVPVTAIDVTTPITASATYAPPYPAEAYDEPLEDAIRL